MSFFKNLFRRSSASTTSNNTNTNQVPVQGVPRGSRFSQNSRVQSQNYCGDDDDDCFVPDTSSANIKMVDPSAPAPRVGTNGVWINFILDESGSMMPVANETIANFNNYINKQKEVRVKVPEEELVEGAASSSSSSSSTSTSSPSPQVQGSTQNSIPTPQPSVVEPTETKDVDLAAEEKASCFVSLTKFDAPHLKDIYDRTLLENVPALSHDTYRPNGGTNLLDAMGHVIGKVDTYLNAIEAVTERPSVLIVILTDGQENESRHYDGKTIKALVESRTAAGWMFVFLGANIDAWSTAEQYGINKANAFNFSVDRQDDVMEALNESTEQWRNVSKVGQVKLKKAVMARPERFEDAVCDYTAQQANYSFFSSDVRARKEKK